MNKSETKKIGIECECGTHILSVQSDVEYFDNHVDPRVRFHQTFDLAMFTYGNYNKPRSIWKRFGIIWNYLKTGEIHKDQLSLTPEEAKKLATFITENIIENDKI